MLFRVADFCKEVIIIKLYSGSNFRIIEGVFNNLWDH